MTRAPTALNPLALACLLASSLLASGMLASCGNRPAAAPAGANSADGKPAAASAVDNVAAIGPASTRLTIYSGDYDALASGDADVARDMPGYALVDSALRFDLKAGNNTITLGGLPRALDVAAVSLRSDAPGVQIAGQRYLGAPASTQAMIARALGQRVAVEHTSGDAKQTDNGILVAAGDDGLTLALADGRTKVIRQFDNFSLLDAGQQPSSQPQMRWTVAAQGGGKAAFSLSYPTGGLAWRAEYLATLAKGDACTLALDGAALVVNQSGVAFPDVALTLVAGQPNRVAENSGTLDRVMVTGARVAGFAAPAPAMPQPVASGEYYAYPIPKKATLGTDGIERIPLFARQASVKCERAYETAPEIGVWTPPRPLIDAGINDASGDQPVKATVSLTNDKVSGLGMPLPAGRVRVFDGGDFLGESALPHTAANGDIHLEVGTAFDLHAKRERLDFRVDKAGRTMTETFKITLSNAKTTDATVQVVEPLPRWSDWEVVASSVPASKRDAQHAQFDVPVPAGGDVALTYTVRYRWAPGVAP